MKLELKHLSPYLPYGLNLKINTPIGTSNRVLELDCGHDFNLHLSEGNVKPILRPLSDLYKNIDINGENIIPVIELANINFPRHAWVIVDKWQFIKTKAGGYTFEWDDGYECWLFDGSSQMNQVALHYKLLEWHFDVFGLIEKGLATDINTLDHA